VDERLRVKRVYERYGASARRRRRWAADNPGNAAIRNELVEAVLALAGSELRAAREILDVGCGAGWWLEQLEARRDVGAVLHGVEILPERASSARSRVPAATVSLADARELPYPGGRFDVVTLFTVLSSMAGRADAHVALREARRVLAPRGALVIWEPRIPNPFNRNTLLIDTALVRAALGDSLLEVRTTTLLPPLARSLGSATEALYPRLSQIPFLKTHRLIAARAARVASL
jgi:ubiquinone/menaquinone biosynthesis C-methylase UbiE